MHKDPVADAVVEHVKGAVAVDSHGQSVVHIPRDAWREAVRFLKEEQQFTQCSDLTAVDQLLRPDRPLPPGVDRERFEVVANFLSHPRNRRIRLICQAGDGEPVESLFEVYSGTELPEREVWDLLGVP
ncbi:MAG: NADH-quinone oxidoreductase subunit, partial [Actinomycetota bacterium]|nr:NADH-quinone oxidoreductase subunit [Actinomycetota bacterium]